MEETWLSDNQNITLPGFKFYPWNRKKEKGMSRGGVGIFIRNEIKQFIKIRYDLSCENFLWCKINKKHFEYDDDLYVGIVYIPPENSTSEKRLNLD